MPVDIDTIVIGGGVCGCAVAWELSRRGGGEIAVLERNPRIPGENQSTRNSGVIHAGIYYPRDREPLKARLCVEGNRLLYEFCAEHGVPHRRTGKLVVATDAEEEAYLDDVERIARENGVPGVERLDAAAVRRLEPNVSATAALYFPSTGIVDAAAYVGRLAALAESNGVIFAPGHEVVDVRPAGEGIEVVAKIRNRVEALRCRRLVNAAGLYADIIAKMLDPSNPWRIVPVRGESAKFYRTRRDDVAMNGLCVYPVPHGHFPDGRRLRASFSAFEALYRAGKVARTTGIHLTPTLEPGEEWGGGRADGDGGQAAHPGGGGAAGAGAPLGSTVTIGPAYATGRIDREDYAPTRKEGDYLEAVRPFFPGLRLEDIELHQTGIHAKLEGLTDFVAQRDRSHPAVLHLVGIQSPGLTASLALARHAAEISDG
jgi:L-2-hydroxyglutarate oxidase LhgO